VELRTMHGQNHIKFILVNSTIQIICKHRTKIISVFARNGSKMKRFRRPERTDLDGSPLKWLSNRNVTTPQWAVLFS